MDSILRYYPDITCYYQGAIVRVFHLIFLSLIVNIIVKFISIINTIVKLISISNIITKISDYKLPSPL